MKKSSAAALACLMACLCASSAPAERAFIPYTMAGFDFDRIRPVPVLSTKHSEETMTTWVESSMKMDWASVNMDLVDVPIALDGDAVSFTYSTEGLKRQVGAVQPGKITSDAYLEWVDLASCPTERDALAYALDCFDEYAEYGYRADPSMFFNVDIYGIADDGTETYLETRTLPGGTGEKERSAALDGMREECAASYPSCASFRFDAEDDYQGGWDLFAVNAASVDVLCGDDAYMVGIGRQISVHGRDGVPHTVYASTDADLFETDMECTGTILTWKKNGNTGVWYVATVEACYENSFTAVISAHYLHDKGTSLVNYDVTFINEGITYTVRFSPKGKLLRAQAEAPFGTYITAGSSTEWEWVNTVDFSYEKEGRLLPLKELTLKRFWQ